jgi:hypothetical protein
MLYQPNCSLLSYFIQVLHLYYLTLPGLIRISKQLDYRLAIADVLNSWKDLLNVLPENNILSIEIININVFNISCCASDAK